MGLFPITINQYIDLILPSVTVMNVSETQNRNHHKSATFLYKRACRQHMSIKCQFPLIECIPNHHQSYNLARCYHQTRPGEKKKSGIEIIPNRQHSKNTIKPATRVYSISTHTHNQKSITLLIILPATVANVSETPRYTRKGNRNYLS